METRQHSGGITTEYSAIPAIAAVFYANVVSIPAVSVVLPSCPYSCSPLIPITMMSATCKMGRTWRILNLRLAQ